MINEANYVGFYIIFTPHEYDLEIWEETRCPNTECINNKKEQPDTVKFCPECGTKIEWVECIEKIKKTFSSYYSNLDIDSISKPDAHIHDWFWSPEYIDNCRNIDYREVTLPPNATVILLNRNFGANYPDEKDIFIKHPATRFLLDQLKINYEIHYGLVEYSH